MHSGVFPSIGEEAELPSDNYGPLTARTRMPFGSASGTIVV